MSSRDRADYIENGLLRMRGLRNETRWRTRLGIVTVSKHQLHRSPTDDLAWLQMPCPTTEPPFSTKVNATVRIGLKEVTALGRSQLCVKVTVKACPNHSGSNDSSRTRWAGFPQKVEPELIELACSWLILEAILRNRMGDWGEQAMSTTVSEGGSVLSSKSSEKPWNKP